MSLSVNFSISAYMYMIFFSEFSSFSSFFLIACVSPPTLLFAVRLEASKSEDSPPEKTVVKERILEKIDLSKGI